jgi:hypothetical protein
MSSSIKIFICLLVLTFACQPKKEPENTEIESETAVLPPEEIIADPEEKQGEINREEKKKFQGGHRQNELAFPQLKTFSPKDHAGIFVFYNPEYTQVLEEKEVIAGGEPTQTLLKTMLDTKTKDIYTLSFSPGKDNDPLFTFRKNDKTIGTVEADEIILPGNGVIYATGHTRHLFDQRRKFQLRDGKLRETQQPFLYVGLQTKTTASVQIFSDQDFRQTVTSLPAGTEVEVVLASGKNFLLRTPFGLTGWWKNTNSDKTPFEGLTY